MSPEWQEKFRETLALNETFFSRSFSTNELERFSRYYQLVLKWNEQVHLTTITSPQGFAERHVLESAFASQKILHLVNRIWDIGSGAGIPGVPFAILRPDLRVNLIESNKKKAIFLKEVISELKINNLQIFNQRFETIKGLEPEDVITTRALDALGRLAPKLFKLGQAVSQFLLFGNSDLLQITRIYLEPGWKIQSFPVPAAKTRLLISCSRFT